MSLPLQNKYLAYVWIACGTFFMAVGIRFIYEPMTMITGGFSGIAIIVTKLFGIPVWITTFVLNIPLFIIAIRQKGLAFVGGTIYASVCFSLFLSLLPVVTIQQEDYLMAAILGGVLTGVGLGCVFSQAVSTGGTDLLSAILQPVFPHIPVANILFVIDGVIVAMGISLFGVKLGLYSIVAVFITSRIMDRIVEGLKFAKLVYVITEKSGSMAQTIMEELDRGVTRLSARGMYTGKDKSMLVCVVSKKEVINLSRIVTHMDPRAFIIITDAREVRGEGFVKNE